jgi:hypothetical protein
MPQQARRGYREADGQQNQLEPVDYASIKELDAQLEECTFAASISAIL